MRTLVIASAPTSEPLTLAEAKDHLRETTTNRDTYITTLIKVARERVETITRRALITQVWDYKLSRFPGWDIEIPLPPLVSVGSITYLESAAGNSTVLAASEYRVAGVNGHNPGRVTPEFGKSWPTTYGVEEAVTVRFTAGYGAAAAVPAEIKQAMLLLLAAWNENAEEIVAGVSVSTLPMPVSAMSILRSYVVDYP
jgi:uncharacterized phiE125 gp8 family phage protein